MSNFLKKYSPYFIILGVITALFYSTGYNRNWSFWADQELTLGYNGLLIHSGMNQEYTDHPGFFSIHLIAFLFQLSHFFGFSEINNISGLNQTSSMFEAMRYLVITARHAALICTMTLIFGIYYLGKKVFKGSQVALLIAFLGFVSNGVFYHFTATRTELIAFIFLMLSIYCFITSYQKSKCVSYTFLQLCLIFLFCSALNKAQTLVIAPFYFCWATYFIPHNKVIAKKAADSQKIVFLSALSFAFLAYFYFMQSRGIGFLFNFLFIGFFNLLVAGIAIKIRQENPFRAILIFNVCYLTAFIGTEAISSYLNLGISIFGNIADPVSMTRFISGPDNPLGATPLVDQSFVKIMSFALRPLIETFSKFTSPTLLIGFCAGYLFYYRKTILNKEWWFAGFSLISFYIISLVGKLRYLDSPHYLIFAEFFLLTFALLLIFKMPQRRQKQTLGILIFLIMLANLVPYTNYYNWLIRKGSHPFCQSGLIHLHQKMDIKRIEQECSQPSKEQ